MRQSLIVIGIRVFARLYCSEHIPTWLGTVLCPGAGAFEVGGGAQDGGVGALPPGDLQPDGPSVRGEAGGY